MPRNLPDTVLLLHNQPESNAAGAESIAGVMDQVRAVEKAMVALGVKVERMGVSSLAEAGRAITRSTAPVVFNLVEAFVSRIPEGREASPTCPSKHWRSGRPPSGLGDAELIPALCKTFGKGVTGNDTPTLLLTLDKWKTKSVLQAAGIPTPQGVLVRMADASFYRDVKRERRVRHPAYIPNPNAVGRLSESASGALPPTPWIVKPVSSDASEGITRDSMIRKPNMVLLRKQVARVHRDFNQAALVEACVGDREINVSLLQTGKGLTVLPLAEIDFTRLKKNEPKIVDYEAKWNPTSHRYKATRRVVPAKLPEAIAQRIRSVARAAWAAVGCRHYARVDLRLDASGALYALEVNANPDISPDAGFVAALEAGGMSFKEFVKALVVDAYGKTNAADSESRPTTRKPALVGRVSHPAVSRSSIRRSRASDRPAVEKLLAQPRYFKPFEVVVALEVLDDAHKGGANGHYQSFVALQRGRLVGWICYGHAPCTEGSYDTYWIAVDPKCQRQGVGAALIRFVEARMLKGGGRQSLLDTAGRPDYEPTRGFYLRMGYAELSRVPDFYAPGDDKVTYGKKLG